MKCTPVGLIFNNETNGYAVVRYYTEERLPPAVSRTSKNGEFVGFGIGIPYTEGTYIDIHGKWADKGSYGYQLDVERYEECLPSEKEDIIRYLSSGLIKGIGSVAAGRIVEAFGENTFDIIEKEPERLLAIAGITSNKLDDIILSYNESKHIREVTACLSSYKLSPKKILAVQEHFGVETIYVVKEAPYRLCEMTGFSFASVEKIEIHKKGFKPHQQFRIQAALLQILKNAESQGHAYLVYDELIQKCMYLLNQNLYHDGVNKTEIDAVGSEMMKRKELMATGKCIYRKKLYLAEIEIVTHILRIMFAKGNELDVSQYISRVMKDSSIVMEKKQLEAVLSAFKNRIVIITGGPGTGKTTIINTITKICEIVEPDKNILLAAPTGKAARKMAETTGYPAMTMHKAAHLLSDEDGEIIDKETDIAEETIILDEMSMVDLPLFQYFLRKIKNARLILLGDVNQLPPVGPGRVFRELIISKMVPTIYLDVNFRQESGSKVILNGQKILAGDKQLEYDGSFQLIGAQNVEEASKKIQDIFMHELQKTGNDLEAVQVLSPLRVKTAAGANALNVEIRNLVNPIHKGDMEFKLGREYFYIGDKVMQLTNGEEVFNGDTGLVTDIYPDEENIMRLEAEFSDGRLCTYSKDDVGALTHAYAMSVHKSQGSEIPVVIIPMLMIFGEKVLIRCLLYTAVTRARKVYIVGQKSAVEKAIESNLGIRRNTLLAWRLRKAVKKVIEKNEQQKNGPYQLTIEDIAS